MLVAGVAAFGLLVSASVAEAASFVARLKAPGHHPKAGKLLVELAAAPPGVAVVPRVSAVLPRLPGALASGGGLQWIAKG